MSFLSARADTLYRSDARGRLLKVNQWDGGAPPRFHLMRSATEAMPLYRADVAPAQIAALERIAQGEPPSLARLPAQADAYCAALAPIQKIHSGPLFVFPETITQPANMAAIDASNAALLVDHLPDWQPDARHRAPFLVALVDGRAVSVCASVRISPTLHCAGVETAPAYRHSGHGARVVAAWANAVRALGATPLYSTSWDNTASQALAASLGLTLAAVDFHLS